MGYTTEFSGKFDLNKKLDKKTHTFLDKLNATRRMKRKLPAKYGVDGEFFVDDAGDFGQSRTPDIVDYNTPPATQPGLWCQWRPTDDGLGIEWDEGEKFYHYVEWIKYIIEKVLEPKGYILGGTVKWRGEDFDDIGAITIENNEIHVIQGRF